MLLAIKYPSHVLRTPRVLMYPNEQEYMMYRAQTRNATPIRFQSQATRILPGHGTGLLQQAVNDDDYIEGVSRLRLVVSVLGNALGGALLLASLFVLPHIVAGIFI